VNLSFDAYDAWQLYERLRAEGAALAPDLVVLHAGDVDVGNGRHAGLVDPDPRTLNWEPVMRRLRAERAGGGPSLVARAKHASYLTMWLLGARAAQTTLPPVTPRQLEKTPVHDDAVGYFARNMLRAWSVAAGSGAAVVFSTPPSGIHPGFPMRTARFSYWLGTADATQRYRERLADRLASLERCLAADGAMVGYARVPLTPAGFVDDVHPNAAGNRVVAEGLAAAAAPLLARLDSPRAAGPGAAPVAPAAAVASAREGRGACADAPSVAPSAP
jgi:hypothetical protein